MSPKDKTCLSRFGALAYSAMPGPICWLVGCLTSQQHASVSQGRICTDNLTCCHTEIEVADPTFYLTQSQYTDTGPTSSSADPITPGAWQGSHWSANFWVTGMTRPGKIPAQAGFEPGTFRSRGGRLNHQANEAVCLVPNPEDKGWGLYIGLNTSPTKIIVVLWKLQQGKHIQLAGQMHVICCCRTC